MPTENTARIGGQGKAVGCVPPTALLFEQVALTRSASGDAPGGGGLETLMRGPISELVIIVILGFLVGCIGAALVQFIP